MTLTLFQSELVQVSSISSLNTIKILPSNSKKKKQKFAVGDDNGMLSVFQMKKGEPQNVFKSISMGGKINCLDLGGSSGAKDKMFVACDEKVIGITKKGKEFFKFQSNLTEKINSIYVEDTKLWTATDFVYNQFEDGVDKHFYMCSDRINALTVENLTNDFEYNAILGCQDKTIRVLQGTEQVLKKSVSSPLTALARFPVEYQGPKRFLYATENGQLGQFVLKSNKLQITWKLPEGYKGGSVNCIDVFDITKDGTPNIMVGRDDGKVQVFSLDDSGLSLAFEYCDSESIRGIDSGVVCTPTFNEVIYCTYSGKIVSLTSEPLDQPDGNDTYGRTRESIQKEMRIQKLKKEITSLEEKVTKEKQKSMRPVGETIATSEEFNVNCKCVLDPDEAAYAITVEIPMLMDMIALQSSISIEFLETPENKAIFNRCPPDPENNCVLLATYRCHEPTSRLEIRMRTIEGQYGDLNMTVIANSTPKSAQSLKLNIKPLSLHHRVNVVQENDTPKHTNMLRLSGSFSLLQMHEWVSNCLPNVPERLQDTDEEIQLYYRNVFLKNLLMCKYRKGDAIFTSQSMSSLAIIKEVIVKEATCRKIQIHIHYEIDEQSIDDFLLLIHPKLEATFQLAHKVELIEAIKEIDMMQVDNMNTWLSPEYQDILKNSEQIIKNFQASPKALEYLTGIVTDLFIDLHKFQGQNVNYKIPQLIQLLKSYKYNDLVQFFKNSNTIP